MKFYTIQTLEFWENNKNNKYLENDYKYVTEEWVTPYKWMYKQMCERIEEVDSSMIWVWTNRPDLRHSGYSDRGDECVLLELELDESQVLLSDFDMWHLPLNDITVDMYDNENIDKEKSWERIFDFDLCIEINKIAEEIYLEDIPFEPNKNIEIIKQGVTSKASLDNVKLIKIFKAK
ncbi:DUF3841 domain-containing protein [Terrisporobacter petrolearius]|uniref:DUF3841 domain-containing protein n=1 Tax=Terrisporobacter petrolearius TaxID=1460447 RepID=UPI0031CC8677